MKNRVKQIRLLPMLGLMLLSTGCWQTITLTEADALLKHPQFQAAAIAAPEFTRTALKKVNELEYRMKDAKRDNK